jgi:predicted GNAT superfamily acetyltransferase
MKNMQPRLSIRTLTRYADFRKLVYIQQQVWGHDDTDITPTHQFCISSIMGAIILGAFVGNELAGFVYSFPAVLGKEIIQHSHMLAVLPQYRGCGIGKKLKWAQRDRALKLGYGRITWTVDPLQARNANLNFHTLGAVCRTYLRDFYGRDSALVLGPGIPTDRLLMEWPIRQKRVGMRRRGKIRGPQSKVIAKALEKIPPKGPRRQKSTEKFALPGKPVLTLDDRLLLAEVPPAIDALRGKPQVIAAWQKALRLVLEHYFGRGYVAVDFIFGGRCFYLLKLDTKSFS